MRVRRRIRESFGVVALALAAVGTGALSVLAYQHTYAAPAAMPAGAPQAQYSATPNPATPRPADPATGGAASPAATAQTVSVLSDSRAPWLRRPLVSGRIDGYELGAVAVSPGADTGTIDGLVPRTADSDWVVVQAGSSDIVDGATPKQTAAGLKSVATHVSDSGPSVIVALVPPSDVQPTDVLTVNTRLRRWASRQGIGVLDTYSPLADPDGTYRTGLSDDGMHANATGTRVEVRAVTRQLPSLLG